MLSTQKISLNPSTNVFETSCFPADKWTQTHEQMQLLM